MKGNNTKKATKKQTSKTTSAKAKQKNALKCAEPKSPKKSTGNTAKKSAEKPKKARQTKVEKAEALRTQNIKDMNRMERIVKAWNEKIDKSKSRKERKLIDKEYGTKFAAAEKVESASYKAYSDFVTTNFSKEKQEFAMAKSKDFMSKKFTNALAGGR